jgi:hypothetical protein
VQQLARVEEVVALPQARDDMKVSSRALIQNAVPRNTARDLRQ